VAALSCRNQSSLKEQRLEAEKFYSSVGLKRPTKGSMDKGELVDAVRNALYASKICSYAQVSDGRTRFTRYGRIDVLLCGQRVRLAQCLV
jgi:6-phosphogluconate dehydrogenase